MRDRPARGRWHVAGEVVVLAAVALLVPELPVEVACRLGLAAVAGWWALRVYGPTAALAATALTAFALPLAAAAPDAVVGRLAAAAQLVLALLLMRSLLDPTLQGIGAAGVALAAALLAGELAHQGALGRAWLVGFSVLVAAARVATADRTEPRGRTVQASAVTVALVWGVGLALLAGAERLLPLPSPDDYVRRAPVELPIVYAGMSVEHPARSPEQTGVISWAASHAGLAIPLVLAAGRPWRRARRYADAVLVGMLLCLMVPGGRVALPGTAAVLAVLGAGWWAAAPWRRWAGTAALGAQVIVSMALAPPARHEGDRARAPVTVLGPAVTAQR